MGNPKSDLSSRRLGRDFEETGTDNVGRGSNVFEVRGERRGRAMGSTSVDCREVSCERRVHLKTVKKGGRRRVSFGEEEGLGMIYVLFYYPR